MSNKNNEGKRNKQQINRFKDALKDTLGSSIKKPIAARLGYKDSNGITFVKVPAGRSDQPNRYYFHEAGGNSFQGEAFLQPGALKETQIRYGTPILVKKNPLSAEWEIVAIDAQYAEQFFDGVDEDEDRIVPYSQLGPGLLTQTTPLSMSALVLEGTYGSGKEWIWVPTQRTVDWSESTDASYVPSTQGFSRYVLVQLDGKTGELGYKYGIEFVSTLSWRQVYNLNRITLNSDYLPKTDKGQYLCGYIRLIANMESISRRGNIVSLQSYLGGGTGSSDVLDRIVTSGGQVVVDTDGNVVYTST